MSFLYPLGLLGLIGIPILIIIYIIKTKYTEQTVASTYLWLLSERFLKRKNPFSKISGIISLILQMLAITLISFGIAHPMFTLTGAAHEYVFILDASASMNMQQGEQTRFDAAKEEIALQIEEATPGSRYTLIYAGSDAMTVYEQLTDKDSALLLLQEQEPGHDESSLNMAVEMAQRYFNNDPSILISMYSDAEHMVGDNIRLVNVAAQEQNFGVSNITYSITGGKLTVMGDLVSYGGEEALEVYLYVDGEQEPVASNMSIVTEEQSARFQLSCKRETFASLRIEVQAEDDLAHDNVFYIYDTKSDSAYNTLVVSDMNTFILSALKAMGHVNYTAVTTAEFEADMRGEASGYGLYIFDSYTPAILPSDGAVWMINPTASVENSGFSVQGVMEMTEGPGVLEQTESSASLVRTLLSDVMGKNIYLRRYVKCGLYRNFTTLYSYNNHPVVFAGVNNYGNRQVVIAADLHDMDVPLVVDYVLLMRNFFAYSFPEVVEQDTYYVGDLVPVNVISNCESIQVTTPSGGVSYLSTELAVSEVTLTETGTYTIVATVEGQRRTFQIFAAVPESERTPAGEALEVFVQGQAVEGGFDGAYDPLTILFILLGVIFIVEWGVYCYEKRQLR